MTKRLTVVVCALVLVAPACTKSVKGPQTFRVSMDAPSAAGKNLQFSSFFPAALKARPGDSIAIDNAGTDAPHTFTFGVKPDRSNQPPPILPTGAENPAVNMPCAASGAPKTVWTKCPSKVRRLPAYDGSGYWNSGFLLPSAVANAPHRLTLKLAKSIAPGSYSFLCVLHGPMTGVIQVVGADGDRSKPSVVAASARRQMKAAQTDGDSIPQPKVGGTGTSFTAAAGWSNASTAVNRFLPATVNVKRGTTVTWQAFSPFEPHTVSIGSKFKAGVPTSGSFAPTGIKSGSEYTGGDANSGIFGAAGGPFPPGPFSLTFTKTGSYTFVCILHPGMTGTVNVT